MTAPIGATAHSRKVQKFSVILKLRAPILVHATEPRRHGLDSPTLRQRATGSPFLPGTLVKGRLRQASEELMPLARADSTLTDDFTQEWFGQRSAAFGSDPRLRAQSGTLWVSDFVAITPPAEADRVRISRDPVRGAAVERALQLIELPYAPGAEVAFNGQVHVWLETGQEDPAAAWLRTCFLWNEQWGALRGIGFGTLLSVELTPLLLNSVGTIPAAAVSAVEQPAQDISRLSLRLFPEGPLCMARPRASTNLFESEDFIAGGIIKGALAATWNRSLALPPATPIAEATHGDRPELARYFSRLRITHAFPTTVGNRWRPELPPLSLVSVPGEEGEELVDVALLDGPHVFCDRDRCVAPAFRPDWKFETTALAGEISGWPIVPRELRTRTRIERDHRRAKESELFTYEMILPEGLEWHAVLDLGLIVEPFRATVLRQMIELIGHELECVGKTRERVRVELDSAEAVLPISASGPWIITLQSDALLVDPALVSVTDPAAVDTGLATAYERAWRSLLGSPRLQLLRWFTQERLAGGPYFQRRFGKQPDGIYEPYFLTEKESVFVIDGLDAQLRSRLDDCAAHGLPLPNDLGKRYGPSWEQHPFHRENGYGEIQVRSEPWKGLEPKGHYEPVR